MSYKPDKAAKRKAKLKAKRVHAELHHHLHLAGSVASTLMDLCADVLPEHIDDSKELDLVGPQDSRTWSRETSPSPTVRRSTISQ